MSAQELPNSSIDVEVHRGWSIGLAISPALMWAELKQTEEGELIDEAFAFREETEEAKFGYELGLRANYRWNEHCSIDIGLEHSNRGYQTSKFDLSFGDIIDPRRGFGFDDAVAGAEAVRFIYHYEYLGLPIRFNYSVGQGRYRFVSSIGCTFEYLLGVRSSTLFDLENGEHVHQSATLHNDYEEFGIRPNLALGAQYQLGEGMSLRCMPTFNLGISPTLESSIEEHLFSAGVELGLFLQL
jgi:hypothetical protein